MKEHSIKCATKNVTDPKQVLHDCDCDGYHTFDELYEHRIRLFIALCKAYHPPVWCSVLHSDGSKYEDWFILGMGREKGKQITYHLPARFWNEVCEFAEVLEKAPEFDGHTSQDVLERLKNL